MVRLESGPAKTDSLWNLAFTVLCLGLAGWFFYDARIGYVAKNRDEAHKQMNSLFEKGQALPTEWGENPGDPNAEAAAIRAFNPTRISDIEQRLGPAKLVKPGAPGESIHFFISDYGKIEVPVLNGQVTVAGIKGATWGHTREQAVAQYYWGAIPLLGLLYVLPKLLRSISLRATIDDEGLTYGAKRIPFADMIALRDYSPKGWVDLHFRSDGREQKIRIDNQKIAKFDEIVTMISAEKAFPNPLLEDPDADTDESEESTTA